MAPNPTTAVKELQSALAPSRERGRRRPVLHATISQRAKELLEDTQDRLSTGEAGRITDPKLSRLVDYLILTYLPRLRKRLGLKEGV